MADCLKKGDYGATFQVFQTQIAPIQGDVDRTNNLANDFQNSNIVLSHINVNKLEDINTRSVKTVFLIVANTVRLWALRRSREGGILGARAAMGHNPDIND